MRNLKITNHMKKITYSNISKEKLDEFFSSGYNKRLKDKCKGAYTMFDFKQGIIIGNHLVRIDEDRYIVDLEDIIKELEEQIESTKTENEEM